MLRAEIEFFWDKYWPSKRSDLCSLAVICYTHYKFILEYENVDTCSFIATKSGLCPCFVSVHWYLTTILMWEKRLSHYAGRLRGWITQRQLQPGKSQSLSTFIAWNCWAWPDNKCLLEDKSWEIRSSLLLFEKIQGSLSPLLASVTPGPSSAPCAKDTLHWVAPAGNGKKKCHIQSPAACAGISYLFLTELWADFLNTVSNNFSSIAILPNWFSCFPKCNICVRGLFVLQLTSWQPNCLSSDHTFPCYC